jgi:hypothetical protein
VAAAGAMRTGLGAGRGVAAPPAAGEVCARGSGDGKASGIGVSADEPPRRGITITRHDEASSTSMPMS